MTGKPLSGSILRRRLAALAAGVERHHVVPQLYIAALCLLYLMWNAWTASTIYACAVMPLALCLVRRSDLKPILASPIFNLAALYFAALGLAAVAAPDAVPAMIANHVKHALQILSFLAITAVLMRRDPGFPKQLFLVLPSAASVAAVINLVAFWHRHPHGLLSEQLGGVSGVSMYDNPNLIGAVNAVACAGCFALLAGPRLPRRQLVVTLAAALVLLVTLTLIMSRGSLAATLAAGLVALMLSGSWQRRLLMSGVFATVLFLLALAMPLLRMAVGRGDSFRLSLWQYYLDLAAQRPWLGYGLSFNTGIGLPNGLLIGHPHSMIIAALIRGGLISVAALIALLVAAVYRAFRSRKSKGGLFAPVLLAAALVATSVDFEISATSFDWRWLLLWLPIGLSLGSGVGGREQVRR